MILLLSWKTKLANYGLAQGAIPVFMMPAGRAGKTFTVFKNKDGIVLYNVWSVIKYKKGNIWFGGSIIKDRKRNILYVKAGLWRYDGSTYTKVSQLPQMMMRRTNV